MGRPDGGDPLAPIRTQTLANSRADADGDTPRSVRTLLPAALGLGLVVLYLFWIVVAQLRCLVFLGLMGAAASALLFLSPHSPLRDVTGRSVSWP